MSDHERLLGHLDEIEEALRRIERRFVRIAEVNDFLATDEGLDRLDAIGMMLIWMGESIKNFDRAGGGPYLDQFPDVDWKGAKGLRDVLSHNYGGISPEAIYEACRTHIEPLAAAVATIRDQIHSGLS